MSQDLEIRQLELQRSQILRENKCERALIDSAKQRLAEIDAERDELIESINKKHAVIEERTKEYFAAGDKLRKLQPVTLDNVV